MNKIKEYRKKMGLTQIELARACNVSQAALSGYETGRYEPDMATMRRLASFFDISLDDLFGVSDFELDPQSNISELEYALLGEIRSLTDAEKQDAIEYIRFKRAQHTKNRRQ